MNDSFEKNFTSKKQWKFFIRETNREKTFITHKTD